MSDHDGDRGRAWLEKLLDLTGFSSSVTVDLSRLDSEEGSCWLTIGSDSLSQHQIDALIGDRGKVLDALQYLANTTLNLNCERDEQHAYTIELNGYRVQRKAELQNIAEEAAEKVRTTGEEYEIRSLSSAERRQIHTIFQDWDDFATESRGREPDRRLVVKLRQGSEDSDVDE
ncbi:R3H domain-containing nucleic acid-binding protein [Okeania sp. SIO2G5]|uniref:Jag family protein n=1 Tax=Okeania sp. SIO2G5 TaxID=2607796 RepID=UPI0013BFAD17|nr:R3H domain-containing nucleic acid-binding protein [Okeania sp. SIO2G5]NEP76415.1 RNA-binding protein [Okeania sp. SIO2G5]